MHMVWMPENNSKLVHCGKSFSIVRTCKIKKRKVKTCWKYFWNVHVNLIQWKQCNSVTCAVWNGAVQTEFKVIYNDFASQFKRCCNKAELFIVLNISVAVSSNMRFYYFSFEMKEEFVMRSSSQSEIFDSRAVTRVTDLTTYICNCIWINLLL